MLNKNKFFSIFLLILVVNIYWPNEINDQTDMTIQYDDDIKRAYDVSSLVNNSQPIFVTSNSALTSLASTRGWTGDGSSSNPITIRDLVINATLTDYGVFLGSVSLYFTIDNVTVFNGRGLYESYWFSSSSNGYITNSMALNGTRTGFKITSSSNIVLENCYVDTVSLYGVSISGSSNIQILNNIVTGASYGFDIGDNLQDIIIQNNTAYGNAYGFHSLTFTSSNVTLSNNTANSNSLVGFTLDSNSLSGDLLEANNNGQHGIYIQRGQINISNSIINNNGVNGLQIGSSIINSTITNNKISSNGQYGISTIVDYTTIIGNEISSNSKSGISISSSFNFISQNTIYSNLNHGFLMSSTYNNTITYNNISFNSNFGISMFGTNNYNSIYLNILEGNYNSSTIAEASDSSSNINYWSKDVVGNYWGDYTGIDSNSDGLGDTAYILNGGAKDNYPLMNTKIIEGIDDISPIVNFIQDKIVNITESNVNISWELFDMFPDAFTVYKNDSNISQGSWNNSVPLTISIDNSFEASYNFTLVANDTSNNIMIDEVWIFVVNETINPVVTPLNDFVIIYNTTGNELSWNVVDDNPSNYKIYKNGSLFDSGIWSSSFITVSIDGLSVGIHQFVLEVYDIYGNFKNESVTVTVEYEQVNPTISFIGDVTFLLGTTGHNLTWNPKDSNPGTYYLYKNGVLIDSNTWNNGTVIFVNLDILDYGVYNYTLLVLDYYNNTIQDTVIVTIYHESDNPILEQYSDFSFLLGTTGHNLTWNPKDSNPGIYYLYKDGVLVESNPWSNSTQVFVDLDLLGYGVYNYTVMVLDLYNNTNFDTVIVTIYHETESPTIEQYNDFSFLLGTTGHNLTWNPKDPNPSVYYLYKDGILVESNSWTNTTQIYVNLDSLNYGTYNYTLIIRDIYNNSNFDIVIITIYFETVNPIIEQYNDFNFMLGTTGHNLTWNPKDSNPGVYYLYKDGALVESNSWSNVTQIYVNLDSLNYGVYNYTLIVLDYYNNTVQNTVLVTVYHETVNPALEQYLDISFQLGSTGHNLTWNPKDSNPGVYFLYKNGALVESNSWTNTTQVYVDLDLLGYGVYNYTIVVLDYYNNTVQNTVMVTIYYENVNPILEQYDDFSFLEGTLGYSITWHPKDSNPGVYNLYRNGMKITSGYWDNSTSVFISFNFFAYGVYNYTLVVFDYYNNSVTDTVIVTIYHELVEPEINTINDFTMEVGSLAYDQEWNPGDEHPGSFYLYRNNELIMSSTWDNTTTIPVYLNNLAIGTYNFTLVILDSYNNTKITSFTANIVFDLTNPIIMGTSQLGVTENIDQINLTWYVTEKSDYNYSILINGNLVEVGVATPNAPIVYTYNINQNGIYNITVLIFDAYGNSASYSTTLTVNKPITTISTSSSSISTTVSSSQSPSTTSSNQSNTSSIPQNTGFEPFITIISIFLSFAFIMNKRRRK